jgi:UDPglucose 6-dehydrogenase
MYGKAKLCRSEEGAILHIVDPKVSKRQMAQVLGHAAMAGEGSWHCVPDVEQAASGADELLLLTEWQVFAQIDWSAVAAVMWLPAWLFDARALADAEAGRAAELKLWTVGERYDDRSLCFARRFSPMGNSTTELLH